MSQLKRGAFLSYLNILLVNVVGLFLTPFIVRSLGNSEYGLYSLIGSLIAYLSLMDLGLNNTIVRFVSKFQAEKDKEGESVFLGTIMSIYFFISLVLILIGMVFYFRLEHIFKNSLLPSQIKEAKLMFLILLFDIGIALPSGSFLAICTAYGKFVFPKVITIGRYVLRTITVFTILSLGGRGIALVMTDTIFNILVVSVTFYYCIKKLGVRFSFKERNKEIIKNIFSYSVWIFLLAIIQNFQWNTGQIILGMHVKTSVIAIFSVGLMLGGYFGAFAGVINTLLLPKAAQMLSGKANADELTATMIKVGRANSFISFLILSNFILFGKEFIKLWLGDAYALSWNIACVIMIATFVPLTQSFGNSILEIKNKIKPRAIGMLICMLTAIICSYFLAGSFGMYGILFPIATAMIINTIINNVLFVNYFDFKISKFYKETFLFQGIFTILFLLAANFIKRHIAIYSWVQFITWCAVFSGIYVLLFFFIVLKNDERRLILKKT
ncbi:lipopolysaccharide biosynthesis protein [Mucilaginibacter sp. UR6-11]|uniref:lipopolysaccharide biosynthesis protein n=1 Tax=Mucilaginibacter sp. UR6-11 TaxID=1435644 RepID=UPI001E5BD1DA|nr:oligosaccharide flippase family protein [Mucilaginibacter sp. UR6-11]MCC8424852.1 oligosaccharide flippase family protein [Mucilaginibacter sp. UR6-11]